MEFRIESADCLHQRLVLGVEEILEKHFPRLQLVHTLPHRLQWCENRPLNEYERKNRIDALSTEYVLVMVLCTEFFAATKCSAMFFLHAAFVVRVRLEAQLRARTS